MNPDESLTLSTRKNILGFTVPGEYPSPRIVRLAAIANILAGGSKFGFAIIITWVSFNLGDFWGLIFPCFLLPLGMIGLIQAIAFVRAVYRRHQLTEILFVQIGTTFVAPIYTLLASLFAASRGDVISASGSVAIVLMMFLFDLVVLFAICRSKAFCRWMLRKRYAKTGT